MTTGVYNINYRYRVYPALNQVQDVQTGHITHLEPRIMAVLEYLSRYAGQLATREAMIRDIWNNYGGGDEALSQAISLLRKILNDREKNLIQTIPKKGYRLTGTLSTAEIRDRGTKLFNLRLLLRAAVLLYVIGTATYFIYNGFDQQQPKAKQYASLVTSLEQHSLPSNARPATKKFSYARMDSKTASVTARGTNSNNASDQASPTLTDHSQPMFSGSRESKSYHQRDTTAQMITALDYQVTTTMNVSTIIN
jgi:DNA-binding winged helix-turn-helix (wHTH) protein